MSVYHCSSLLLQQPLRLPDAQVSDIYKISISTLKREKRKRREEAAAAAIAWEPTAETAKGAQFSMDDYENIRKG